MKLSFHKPKSAADKKQIQQIIREKTGISAQIDISPESAVNGKDVERRKDATFIVIRCLESQMDQLLSHAFDLEKKYPSFEMAEEISPEKCILPEGTVLIELLFSDAPNKWRGGRAMQLIADIADITRVSKDNIRLVKMKRGSVVIVLRLPKSAALNLLIKESRERKMLKEKFRTLATIEQIAEYLTPLLDPVSVAHAVSTVSRCLMTWTWFRKPQERVGNELIIKQ